MGFTDTCGTKPAHSCEVFKKRLMLLEIDQGCPPVPHGCWKCLVWSWSAQWQGREKEKGWFKFPTPPVPPQAAACSDSNLTDGAARAPQPLFQAICRLRETFLCAQTSEVRECTSRQPLILLPDGLFSITFLKQSSLNFLRINVFMQE